MDKAGKGSVSETIADFNIELISVGEFQMQREKAVLIPHLDGVLLCNPDIGFIVDTSSDIIATKHSEAYNVKLNKGTGSFKISYGDCRGQE
jgi:hypothetical protein